MVSRKAGGLKNVKEAGEDPAMDGGGSGKGGAMAEPGGLSLLFCEPFQGPD